MRTSEAKAAMSEVIVTGDGGRATIVRESSDEQFDQLIDFIMDNLATSSQRVYRHTYQQWREFTLRNQLDVFDLSFEHLSAFLNQGEMAGATRRSWKAHMLRLLDWLEESPTRGEWYAVQRRRLLKFLKGARMESAGGRSRSKRALNRSEVAQLLDLWARDRRPMGVRNYALLRLMIYTGLRRAEVVALRWDDIDFEEQLVTVRHGKGDKERIAAIADITDETIQSLTALWEAQDGAYDHIFPTMTAGYNPRFYTDEAMNAETIVRVVSGGGRRIGIERLSAHDLRRTHITLALNSGAPLSDMQAQAGHANAATTLLYARPADAKTRRARIAF